MAEDNSKQTDCPVTLTEWQRDVLVERVDEVLENTEDWGIYNDDEYREAIQSWIDILKGLNDDKRVAYWIKEYKDICKLL